MEAEDVRRELLALLDGTPALAAGTTGGGEDNGRVIRRTPSASAAATEAPAGRAKPPKKK
jgi:hypothetical protein